MKVTWFHLAALRDVQEGRRKTAPGIARCSKCGEPWLRLDSPLRACRDCRHRVFRRCEDCGTRYRLDRAGHLKCASCRDQLNIFAFTEADPTSISFRTSN